MAKPLYAYLRNIASYFAIQSKQTQVTEEYIKRNAYRLIPTYAKTIYQFGYELAVLEKEAHQKALLPLVNYLEYEEPALLKPLKTLFLQGKTKAYISVKLFGQGLLPYTETNDNTPIFILNALPNTRLSIKKLEGESEVLFEYDTHIVSNAFRLFIALLPSNVQKFEKLLYADIMGYYETMLKWIRTNFVYAFDGRLSTDEQKILSTYICLYYLSGKQFFPKYAPKLLTDLHKNVARIVNKSAQTVKDIIQSAELSITPDKKQFLTLEDLVNLHVEVGIVPAKISDLSISVKLLRYTMYGVYLFGSIAGYSALSVITYKKIPVVAARLFKDISSYWSEKGREYYSLITQK